MNAQTKKTRILAGVVAAIGTIGLAAAAHAGDAPAAQKSKHADVVVRFADLNLDTEAGAKTLYARLSAAAKRACGDGPGTRSLSEHARYEACYEETMNRAVGKVGSRHVQMLHAARIDATVG